MNTATGTIDVAQRVTEYAPLVRRMARYLVAKLPASVEFDDIMQAGLMGLMDAAQRFTDSHGFKFETFASQRIRGAMLDELRQNDWLPRSVRKSARQIETAISKLEQQLGRAPNERELAADLGISLDAFQELLLESRGTRLVHLDDFGKEGDDAYLDSHCPDDRDNPLDRFVDKRFRATLIKAIGGLPEREKKLMGLYYEQEMNFKEIAVVLKVSESRVCQLHSQAVARLRTTLKDW